MISNIPKKYQTVLNDLIKVYDFLYLDSLILVMMWRKENKVFISNDFFRGNGKEALFYKYVYELIDRFYKDNFNREGHRIGEEFATWLLKTPLDYKLQIPHHSEINERHN